jgi:hypothetical protein
MGGLNLDKIVFDDAITQPNIGAVLLDSDGDKLTSTLVSGKQALDVNVVNASIVVSATDLDIRDLVYTQDSVTAYQGTSPWVVGDGGGSLTVDFARLDYSTDNVEIKDAGGDALAINADGSINVNLTDDGIADDAADSGNPLKMGGKAYSSLAADPVDNGDRANLAMDLYRRFYVNDAAHMRIKNTAEAIGTTASEIVATPLAGRKKITIQNLSSNVIYIGFDNTVTVSNGLQLPKNSSFSEALGENVDVWLIANSGASNDVRVLEAA